MGVYLAAIILFALVASAANSKFAFPSLIFAFWVITRPGDFLHTSWGGVQLTYYAPYYFAIYLASLMYSYNRG